MPKAFITIGCSGSGKTTWAKQYTQENPNTINSNRDDFRFSMSGKDNWIGYRFDKEIEAFITEMQVHQMSFAASTNRDIIIGDTNLNERFRQLLKNNLMNYGFTVEEKVFNVPFIELLERNAGRDRPVSMDILKKQYESFSEQGFDKY